MQKKQGLPLDQGRANRETENSEEAPPPQANKIWTSLESSQLAQEHSIEGGEETFQKGWAELVHHRACWEQRKFGQTKGAAPPQKKGTPEPGRKAAS